jgi:Domain of unknown function (DUF3331)
MNPSSSVDPWARTLNMLLQLSEHPVSQQRDSVTTDRSLNRKSTDRRKRERIDHSIPFSLAHIKVQVVERLTETTISVTWHDPTSVNYMEQLWLLGSAHSAGICSLTGAPIARGQSVYKPRRNCKRPALNQNAMILSEMTNAGCSKATSTQDI